MSFALERLNAVNTNFKYVRIQGRDIMANTLTGRGIFSMCFEMIRHQVMNSEDADLFLEINSWFAENLPWPEPCKNQEPVVCFFKTENTEEMINCLKPAMWLLEKYNQPYYLVYTNTPGEIVYEDKYQIVVRTDDISIQPAPKSWYDGV